MSEPDHDRRGYFARNVSSILESGAMRFPVSSEIFKGTHFTAIAFYKTFLASQDALEVMLVSQSVSQSVTLRTELTDVTLVSEDTY